MTTAHVNSADYSYAYDAIGNRAAAVENSSGVASRTEYRTNNLNQYTAEGSFKPTFDADGNQTLIKTSTGIWSVTYNAKNRPILFTKSDGSVTVECTYDTMGRRATKKVTTNGTLTEHRRFLYRGYLQIACCDLTRAYTPALWFITWDPTQPTATRPLAIQKNGTWYTYGWDLTKNICETYRTDGRIDLAYTYTPYGEVSPAHAYDQPIRWSSEYHDTELGLVYYNYRHYNPAVGRWLGRDFLNERNDPNLFRFVKNAPNIHADIFGLTIFSQNQRDDAKNTCCKEERKERNVYISATGNNSIVTLVPEPTIESFISTINNSIKGCECIHKLQIVAHANSTSLYINAKEKEGRASINIGNAHSTFAQIKKSMCTDCIIYMESCHLGLGPLPQEIANATGCKVRAALAYSNGVPGFPFLSTSNIRWRDDANLSTFEKIAYYLSSNYVYVKPNAQNK